MNIFFKFFSIIAVFMPEISGHTNNNTGTSDFYKVSQLNLVREIEITEIKIKEVDVNFADRLEVIKYDHKLLLNEIQHVNQSLMALETLNAVRKTCIREYESQLVSFHHADVRLKSCYNEAKHNKASLTTNARASTLSAKTYTIEQFPKSLNECQKHLNNQTSFELCYIEQVNLAKNHVQHLLKAAEDHLDKSLYEASVISRSAIRCTYKVVKEVLETIGSTVRDINNCQKLYIETSTKSSFSYEHGTTFKNEENVDSVTAVNNGEGADYENFIYKETERY